METYEWKMRNHIAPKKKDKRERERDNSGHGSPELHHADDMKYISFIKQKDRIRTEDIRVFGEVRISLAGKSSSKEMER